jgi:hypothetical protein
MLTGFRSWLIVEVNGRPRLKSPAHVDRFYWEPEEAIALCPACYAKAESIDKLYNEAAERVLNNADIMKAINPDALEKVLLEFRTSLYKEPKDFMDECSCGLYSLNTPEAVIDQHYCYDILGEIILFGRVIRGEKGSRAEKAKVYNLYLPTFRPIREDAILALADEYQANLIKAPEPLYTRICRTRSKNLMNNQQLPYGYSLNTDKFGKEPQSKYGHGTYWGEPDIPKRSIMDGYYNQPG